MKTICSILPDLRNYAGHIYAYTFSLGEAVHRNGWKHIAWVPQDCEITALPEDWEKFLPPTSEAVGFLKSLAYYFKAFKYLRPHAFPVLFLEHFRFSHLVCIFFASLTVKKPLELWLLHRYSPSQMRLKGKLHSFFYKMMEWRFGRNRLRFVTDSELLAQQQEILFSRKVEVFPIPHAQYSGNEKKNKEKGLLYCWWPGVVRETKGFDQICRIAVRLAETHFPFRLVVADTAKEKGIKTSLSVIYVSGQMSREEYGKWLNTVDIALLPYDPIVYQYGTSGVFVEVVSAGVIPVIKAGSWMAYELCKYDLNELILDWDNGAILEQLIALSQDQEVRRKLDVMKRAYQKYHSIEGFARALVRHS